MSIKSAMSTTAAPIRYCRLCYQAEHGTAACNTVTASAENLLRLYSVHFSEAFKPYEGPEEPLGFEPEDYPVR